jgi:hypothetical protein
MLKSTPHLMVGFTAAAALGAVVLLAAEDRALFEPQHAAMLLEAVDPQGAAWAPPLEVRRRLPAVDELQRSDRAPALTRRDRGLGASSAP